MNKHVTSATRYMISFVLIVIAFYFFLELIGVSYEARVGLCIVFTLALALSWAHAFQKQDEPEEKPKERKKVKEV